MLRRLAESSRRCGVRNAFCSFTLLDHHLPRAALRPCSVDYSLIFEARRLSSNDAAIKALTTRLATLEARVGAIEAQGELQSLVAFFSTMPRTPLSLKEVVGKCSDPNYRPEIFCHRELPVLLAHMLRRLDNLPMGLPAMADTRAVKTVLSASFRQLSMAPVPETTAEVKAYADLIRALDEKHDTIVVTLAKGIIELRKLLSRQRDALYRAKKKGSDASNSLTTSNRNSLAEEPVSSSRELQDALDAFYTDLLTFKFLGRQLVTLVDAGGSPTKGFTSCGDEVKKIGMVAQSIDLRDVVRKAAHQAEMICNEHFGDCPKIRVVVDKWKLDESLPHLEDTIVYIVVELLKNSLRATVEAHLKRNSMGMVCCDDMPAVVISVSSGVHSATICVSDQGGGIARREVSRAMSYAFTTVSKPALEQQPSDDAGPSLLAGYGYGLPMSRLYARLFSGDLVLHSVEGFGTDVVVTFAK